MQTSRCGLSRCVRLILLAVFSILAACYEHDWIVTENESPKLKASSELTEKQCPLNSTTTTALLTITPESSRQEIVQKCLEDGNDTFEVLVGKDQKQLSLVDINYFLFHHLRRLNLYH